MAGERREGGREGEWKGGETVDVTDRSVTTGHIKS